jgi:hypothetical protein
MTERRQDADGCIHLVIDEIDLREAVTEIFRLLRRLRDEQAHDQDP